MGIRIDANFHKLKPWLEKNCKIGFVVCFAYPPSKSKKKIMIRLDNKKFFTLWEIEDEIGDEIFTITITDKANIQEK